MGYVAAAQATESLFTGTVKRRRCFFRRRELRPTDFIEISCLSRLSASRLSIVDWSALWPLFSFP